MESHKMIDFTYWLIQKQFDAVFKTIRKNKVQKYLHEKFKSSEQN